MIESKGQEQPTVVQFMQPLLEVSPKRGMLSPAF